MIFGSTRNQFNPLTSISWAHAGWADDPLWTSGKVADGLILYGAANSYAYTADSSPLDITGDITLVVKITPTDWTPASNSVICGKWTASTAWSYLFVLETTGTLRFNWSADGTNINAATSTVATGFTDGVARWVAVTFDVDNGASGRTARFWTSSDGVTWSQLGANVTSATATSLFNSNAVFEIGSNAAGTAAFLTGTIHNVQVWNGIRDLNAASGATLAFDADFANRAGNFAEAANGATVNIGSAARLGQIVSSWRNATGGGDPAQATRANQPALRTAQMNGKSALLFDGTNDWLQANVTDWTTARSWVLIGKLSSSAVSGTEYRIISTGGGHIDRYTTNKWAFAGSGSYLEGTTSDANPHLFSLYQNASGGVSNLYLDGTSNTSGAQTWLTHTHINLGAAGVGNTNWMGNIAFFGIFDGDIHASSNWPAFKAWVASYYGITIA